jgi:hypothetical protein
MCMLLMCVRREWCRMMSASKVTRGWLARGGTVSNDAMMLHDRAGIKHNIPCKPELPTNGNGIEQNGGA